MEQMLFLVPVVGLLRLLSAVILRQQIVRESLSTDRTRGVANAIVEGVSAFLASECRILVVSVAVLFFVIGFGTWNWVTAGCFLMRSGFSTMAGYLDMNAAICANSRTADAARISGMHRTLALTFSGGGVMGMAMVDSGLLGVGVPYILARDVSVLSGFSLGASSITLFTRVGRSICTKAADVGADLVGRVEADIPGDDPHNPAIIADNVGDNVGDVAGMGADLFESYVGSLTSALTLDPVFYQETGIVFPLMLLAYGIITAIIGSLLIKSIDSSDPHKALRAGKYSTTALVVVCSLVLSRIFFGNFMAAFTIITGSLVGVLAGAVTEIYTSGDYCLIKKIAGQSETGSATTIISGIVVGMQLTTVPILLVCVGALIFNKFMGLYGITPATVNMLSTTGITVAIDAYGLIADNAGGIAEVAGLDKNIRDITGKLDSVSNTIAAIGKGFTIDSAALTALALFVSYTEAVKLTTTDILNAYVIVGLFIGGMLTFLFSAMTMEFVSKVVHQMIEEVRRQFKEKPGIPKRTDRPDYASYVSIPTKAALREMFLPGLMAVLAPLVTSLILGLSALNGLLTGALVTGVLMIIFMSDSGDVRDNAEKYIEEEHHGDKGSGSHKATMVGDTVGDSFKDTSGPSINILIKLTTIVSLAFVPLFLRFGGLI